MLLPTLKRNKNTMLEFSLIGISYFFISRIMLTLIQQNQELETLLK